LQISTDHGHLQTEIIALRHELNVLRRKRPERLVLANTNRLLSGRSYRLVPGTPNALSIVKPGTVIGLYRGTDKRHRTALVVLPI